ncbi:lipase member H-like isoform X2 [Centruroides vittatus]|uniref:lipase member H-like isoform X2 n=1 Tax=Centruroides vittatus TaxID=120091 RepID=UPI00350F8A7F
MVTNYILLLILVTMLKETNAQLPCPLPAEIIFSGAENAVVPPTYFLLYTRNNPEYPQNLTFTNCAGNTNYNPNKKTVIMLHGYQGNPNGEEIVFLKSAYLHYEDCNVIFVDWSIAAAASFFPDAIRNTLITGKYVAEQLENWKENCKEINFNKFHVIGFSLGGQTVGFIGKYTKTEKIGRITDVAGICFVKFPPKYKLYYTDGKFVDVITGSAFTQVIMDQPTGHVHFKPDGGLIGRGCADKLLNLKIESVITCSHSRPVYLFASSLYSECLAVGYRCADYETFSRGECSECGKNGEQCAAMGIHSEKYADKIINGTVTMYLPTTFTDDYCLYQYHVEVKLSSGPDSTTEVGKLILIINGRIVKVLNKVQHLQSITESFQPEEKKQYLITTTHNISPIMKVQFYWYTASPRKDNKLYVQCIKIVPMNNLETNRSSLTTYGTTNGEPISPGNIILLALNSSC